ncbi:MAG: hypothetical protein U9R48_03180 [Chloroflexota bacterium]|nr:hypothetical protein [Chloroflexota bacterium]
MNVKERFKYLRMMKKRYEKADRKTKGRLLAICYGLTAPSSLYRMYS